MPQNCTLYKKGFRESKNLGNLWPDRCQMVFVKSTAKNLASNHEMSRQKKSLMPVFCIMNIRIHLRGTQYNFWPVSYSRS